MADMALSLAFVCRLSATAQSSSTLAVNCAGSIFSTACTTQMLVRVTAMTMTALAVPGMTPHLMMWALCNRIFQCFTRQLAVSVGKNICNNCAR